VAAAVKRLALLGVLVVAGCGSQTSQNSAPQHHQQQPPPAKHTPAPRPRTCSARLRPLGSATRAYVGSASHGAVAYRQPGRKVVARFARLNENHYPTMFGVIGVVRDVDCNDRWYRVELPIRPNGAIGYVSARDLKLKAVTSRIEVDLGTKTLTLFRKGRRVLTATVAIGASATPTPLGRYYVNQRLIPDDSQGPFGPAAIGISAFSPVLTGWAQGGPVAIHGTNEPWSIGRAVSNGCVRLPNATLLRVFGVAVAGTPVIIRS
jgi:lipoprotein-anchoring transpeptidase ErfK/SrfK